MKRIRIVQVTNNNFPINVYIADLNLNNQTLIGTITPGPVPPIVTFSIPSIFLTAEKIILLLVDNNNCQTIQILDCLYCIYEIEITQI